MTDEADAKAGKRLLVTGANGLIGAALCTAAERAGWRVSRCGRKGPVVYDALRPVAFDFAVDAIVHAASPACPAEFMKRPAETMMANIYGLKEILDYARRCGARKVVYVSSSEVYGRTSVSANGLKEGDCGEVEILRPRSAYPMGKRAAETLCACYAEEYGLDVSIVRPGHVYGPTCRPTDDRVSSAFVWAAARGEKLVLKSAGLQVRSYTHADDCARAILTVLEKGASGRAYNIGARCGKCTIRRMAAIVARAGGVDLEFERSGDTAAFNPMDDSSLDSSELESLGWQAEITPEVGFAETVRILKEGMK